MPLNCHPRSRIRQSRPDLFDGYFSNARIVTDMRRPSSCLRCSTACVHARFVAYYDWLPPPFWSAEFALRPEFPPPEAVSLLHATVHTFKYLQLLAADAYTYWRNIIIVTALMAFTLNLSERPEHPHTLTPPARRTEA